MNKSDFELSRPFRLDSIDRNGRQEKITASEEEYAALALRFDLLDIDDLSADINILPQQGGLIFHVTGALRAHIQQESIVSGDCVSTTIHIDIDAWYSDQSRVTSFDQARLQRDDTGNQDHEIKTEKDDPEPLYDGILDVGETVAQFLGLALDDYPRTESEVEGAGDYIEIKPEEAKPNPFAALAKLKKD